MKSADILQWILLFAILGSSSTSHCSSNKERQFNNHPLTIFEAEQLAIETAPELKQLEANAESLEQQAIADGQLPDPQLTAGAVNVPTNSFSFNQDDMTMVQVGVQQTFAPGRSLKMKSNKTKALAKAQEEKLQAQKAMLLRNVREAWLDVYYWQQAAEIVHENRSQYQSLLKLTESQYSNAKLNQSDVLQVKVELSRLNDQILQIEQRIDLLRAQLGRWIGTTEANRRLSSSLPRWGNPLPVEELQCRLLGHPLLRADTENIEAARNELAYTQEQYKPGWMLDVNYGIRQGRMADRKPRSNMVTALVTVDLPIFTSNRQDRRLCASAYQLESTKLDRDVHYKDLVKELQTQYAIWKNLSKRENLYQRHLALEANQNTKAAKLAYQNATTDLPTVLRAYANELTIRTEKVQIQVERAKARVALLYFECVTHEVTE